MFPPDHVAPNQFRKVLEAQYFWLSCVHLAICYPYNQNTISSVEVSTNKTKSNSNPK